jgi:ABC-type lipoprotein release transport system permease subunit
LSVPARRGTDWSQAIKLPYVDSYGLFASTAMCLKELGGLESSKLCVQPPVAGGWYDSLSRVEILDGRMATAPDETVINRLAQRRFKLRVGQTLHLETIASDRPLLALESLGPLDDYWNGRPQGDLPWGPTYPLKVVGVYDGDVAARLINGGAGAPGFALPTSFMQTHGDEIDHRVDAVFRLRGGAADVDHLRTDITRLMGPNVPTTSVGDAQRRVERSTLMESAALWAFALAVMAAAIVLIGQAIFRLVRTGGGDAPVLRSLGMSRRQLVAAFAASGLLIALLGGLGAIAVAIAVSPAFPIGVARSFDLHGGVRVDALVLVLGTVGSILAWGAIAIGAAWLAQRASAATPRRSARVRFLPAPVGLGVSWAVSSRDGGAVAVRSALIAVSVAVAATMAAFTMRAGIDDALENPARAGKVWDLAFKAPPDYTDAALTGDKDVAAATFLQSYVVTLGGRPVRGWVPRAIGRPLDPVVVKGRLPSRANEVAMGPATAENLGLEVGDTVAGSPEGNHPYKLVGHVFLPNLSGHESYDEGALLTQAGLDRIGPGASDQSGHFAKLRPGASTEAFAVRVERAGGQAGNGVIEPAAVENLRDVRALPILLAAFFTLLGIGVAGHALVTTLRKRRQDLAVLRALGLSPRQARVAVVSQATTLAAVGVCAGIPLGILGGNLAWHWVADSMPLVYAAPLALAAVLVAIPATVALVNAAAIWPGRSALRRRPGVALRVE